MRFFCFLSGLTDSVHLNNTLLSAPAHCPANTKDIYSGIKAPCCIMDCVHCTLADWKTDTYTGKQVDRQRQIERQTNRQADRQREADKQTCYKWIANRETDHNRQTNRETYSETFQRETATIQANRERHIMTENLEVINRSADVRLQGCLQWLQRDSPINAHKQC